jgi:hypothetical protein
MSEQSNLYQYLHNIVYQANSNIYQAYSNVYQANTNGYFASSLPCQLPTMSILPCQLPTMSILPMSTARRACQIVDPTKCLLLGVHLKSSIMIEAMEI